MSIGFDAASGNFVNPGTSLTVSHTVGSGSNRALVVGVTSDTSDVVTGVTYNGVSLSLVDKIQVSGERWLYAFILLAPDTGTHDIVVSVSGSVFIGLAAASYDGVLQSSQPEADNTGSETTGATSITLSVTTVTDNAWSVLVAKFEGGSVAAGSGSTIRADDSIGITGIFDSNAAITPAGSTNMAAGGVSNTTQPTAIILSLAPVLTDTITVSSPVQYQTYQRDGSDEADITISGTYSGTPTAIEADFNGGGYATIDGSPSGGTFSGTLTGQAAGQGTLTVRYTNDTGVSDTVADVGIGDVFLVIGDSISEGRGTNARSYTHGSLKATAFRQDDAWANGNDPVDTGTSNGSHWPLLATQIMTHESVPVAFVTCGTGSTDIYTANNQWASGNSAYTEMQSQDSSYGGSYKAILAHLGPNAVINDPDRSGYNAALDSFVSAVSTDIQSGIKVCIGLFGEMGTGSPTDREAAINNTRLAIMDAWGDNANIVPGPNLIDQAYADDVHPATDAQLLEVAHRWWAALDEAFYGGPSGRGPRISSATHNASKTEIDVIFDRDLLSSDNAYTASAFTVYDNGTPATISAVRRASSRRVVIELSSAASGAITLSLGSENDASGATIPRSADVTMPDANTINLPAEPFIATNVSAASGGDTIIIPKRRILR